MKKMKRSKKDTMLLAVLYLLSGEDSVVVSNAVKSSRLVLYMEKESIHYIYDLN